MTTAQTKAMEAAERFGFIAQRRASSTSCSVELYPGIDGRSDGARFTYSTVEALVRSGRLVWASTRHSRCGRWVAALARVEG